MIIKNGDNIKVIAGKDKGKTGKVTKAFPATGKIIVDGVNIRKKIIKPKKAGEKGQIVQITAPFDASNVMIVCPSCSKPTRVGSKVLKDGKKNRICKKCNKEL